VSFVELLERTLGWIGKLGLRQHSDFGFRGEVLLPLTCGFLCLTLMFCILVWMQEWPTNSDADRHSIRPILLTMFAYDVVQVLQHA